MARYYAPRFFRRTVTVANQRTSIMTPALLSLGHHNSTHFYRVFSLATNAGNIFIGDDELDTNAEPMAAGLGRGHDVSEVAKTTGIPGEFNLSQQYFIGDTVGDVIVVTYFGRKN